MELSSIPRKNIKPFKAKAFQDSLHFRGSKTQYLIIFPEKIAKMKSFGGKLKKASDDFHEYFGVYPPKKPVVFLLAEHCGNVLMAMRTN